MVLALGSAERADVWHACIADSEAAFFLAMLFEGLFEYKAHTA